jgi:transposase InsO family protein
MPRLFGEQEPEGALGSDAVQEEAAAEMEDTDVVELAEEIEEAGDVQQEVAAPRLTGRVRGRQRLLTKPGGSAKAQLTPEQRLLVLDAWVRSKLPATDFAPLVGVTMHTLYAWKKRFNELGPAGLADRVRGAPTGSRLAEPTRRAILLMKQAHPEWGCERLHDMLMRTQGYAASAGAIGNLLKEEGYEVEQVPTRPHPDRVRSFERSRANQMWQSDLFTFLLKRENRRVWLVAFMDDHSRYVVGYGLHATASGALVREVFEAAVANYGAPEEVLTDNGSQYYTWRGKSVFTKLLERRGIRHVVSRPRHPQTLGKIERFWGTLWRECAELAIFVGLDDARKRIGLFIDHYNFQRTHSGIEGLVPADRYFAAAPQVLATLKARVADNSLQLARNGVPRKTFYLTGRVGEQSIELHGEGSRVILTRDGNREEVDLAAPGQRAEPGTSMDLPEAVAVQGRLESDAADEQEAAGAPGTSVLDEVMETLRASEPEPSGDER